MNDNQSFGPAFDEAQDGARIRGQLEAIRQFMLSAKAWYTLSELHNALDFPESSISADLRHLRKEKHGSYDVKKRRRDGGAQWEYSVVPPVLTPGQFGFAKEKIEGYA